MIAGASCAIPSARASMARHGPSSRAVVIMWDPAK